MPHQFQTNRMSDTTYLKDVDSGYQALEDTIVYFFGLPVDQDLVGRVMQSDVDGNITSVLRQAANGGAAAGPGWRSRDTGGSSEFQIACLNGYLYIWQNTGSQAVPTWTQRNRIELATGLWDVISAAEIGTGCMVYNPYGSETFKTAAFMEFEFEGFDDGSYWSTGARDRFIIPAAGRYNIQWSAYHGISGMHVYQVELMTTLYLNGSPVVSFATGAKEEVDVNGTPVHPGVSVGGEWTFGALSPSDYVQFEFEIWSQSDQAAGLNQSHAMIERIA